MRSVWRPDVVRVEARLTLLLPCHPRLVPEHALEDLRRWESAGGHWHVLSRGPAGLVVSLLRCDGGEEAHRLASDDPALAHYIGDRESSAD
jgi:hypothetical protein